MIQVNDTEYLAKPLIPDTVFIIEEEHVSIRSPSTIHAAVQRHKPLYKNELLALYTQILQLAKERDVRISYTKHYRKKINTLWDEYESTCTLYDKLFYRIRSQAELIRSRGLHYGTRDDMELEKLQVLCAQYGKLFYGGSIVSQVMEVCQALERYQQDFGYQGYEITQIYL